MSSTRDTRTILIVDDKERLRKGLARSLSQENCRTLTAASGEEALALSKGRRIDLVITDLVMPGMDGMALIRNIKSTVPSIKTIIITAYGSAESMQEAEELGVACYLAKPFDLSHLKSKVNELLAGKDEGGRMKDEVRQTPGVKQFILHPSSFVPRCVCVAGGRTLRAAVDLSRRALPYVSPRKIMLGVIIAAGKSIGRVAAATSGLASVFTRSGQLRCPDDAARRSGPLCGADDAARRSGPLCGADDAARRSGPLYGADDAAKKEVNR